MKTDTNIFSGTLVDVTESIAVAGRYVGTGTDTIRRTIVVLSCDTLVSDAVDIAQPRTVETYRHACGIVLLAGTPATPLPSLVAPL